ncbi:hypothetical protein BIW11_14033 [Tropilaelaps mercedesae]|uniref:Uncharacterized protein n=1 Tax=Tropilaelaps mercedesae TaxID=418985 RepID=A0A1V9WZJ7_9ACAR|nr:hypothetical protein BIW11_14033 [Tropilaelaps mercedesae]
MWWKVQRRRNLYHPVVLTFALLFDQAVSSVHNEGNETPTQDQRKKDVEHGDLDDIDLPGLRPKTLNVRLQVVGGHGAKAIEPASSSTPRYSSLPPSGLNDSVLHHHVLLNSYRGERKLLKPGSGAGEAYGIFGKGAETEGFDTIEESDSPVTPPTTSQWVVSGILIAIFAYSVIVSLVAHVYCLSKYCLRGEDEML